VGDSEEGTGQLRLAHETLEDPRYLEQVRVHALQRDDAVGPVAA